MGSKDRGETSAKYYCLNKKGLLPNLDTRGSSAAASGELQSCRSSDLLDQN